MKCRQLRFINVEFFAPRLLYLIRITCSNFRDVHEMKEGRREWVNRVFCLQDGGSFQPKDDSLSLQKMSVSRMHSLPNDSYMFRPVRPASAPYPLPEDGPIGSSLHLGNVLTIHGRWVSMRLRLCVEGPSYLWVGHGQGLGVTALAMSQKFLGHDISGIKSLQVTIALDNKFQVTCVRLIASSRNPSPWFGFPLLQVPQLLFSPSPVGRASCCRCLERLPRHSVTTGAGQGSSHPQWKPTWATASRAANR